MHHLVFFIIGDKKLQIKIEGAYDAKHAADLLKEKIKVVKVTTVGTSDEILDKIINSFLK